MHRAVHINLQKLKNSVLTESAVVKMAGEIRYLLYHLMGPSDPYYRAGVKVTGNRQDLERFKTVISKEKRYMDAYLKYGLNDSRVLNDRASLEKAIYNFERDTGIKWPLK